MVHNDFLNVLPEMVAFVYVAQTGSFSAAARQLHLTSSAINKQISKLEKTLGVQLLTRTTRKLHLTDAGQEILQKCIEVVTAAQGTMQLAEGLMERPKGVVTLAAPKAFAKQVLHPAILKFLDAYPDVDVHLVVTDESLDPLSGNIDLMVRLTKTPPENLSARPLMRVNHILCASPTYLAKHHPIECPSDLADLNCLSIGENDRDHWWRFLRNGEETCVVVSGRYIANHSEIRLDAIQSGLGVGCVPDFVAKSALESGQVVRVLPEWELDVSYHGIAYLLYPPNRFLAPKIRVFIDYLVQHIEANNLAIHFAAVTLTEVAPQI
jgi:DNA-binding transcriptional LysR family regulator